MDPRVILLKEFYRGLPKDRAKIETEAHGFDFLSGLLTGGVELEYGELTLAGALHKYKLAGISESRMDDFLRAHVEKACNVCLYFDERANDLFCFNLDNNSRTDSSALIPETRAAVRILAERLRELGCEPLVVASGRGYHVWGRLEAPVPNDRLHGFMLRAAVAAAAGLHAEGLDRHRIKFNFYPDPRTHHVVSLRLFGSLHAKNKVFSRVMGPEGLLDEPESWERFAAHASDGTIPVGRFDAAFEALSRQA
jgi:hypothetical protein